MTDDLGLPDFRKYRYHLTRWWWLPLVLGVLLALLARGAGFGGTSVTSNAILVPVTPVQVGLFDPTYEPGAGLAAAVEALKSKGVADQIATELGFPPDVTVGVTVPAGTVTIRSSAGSDERAVAARDAYVEWLLTERATELGRSVSAAITAADQRIAALSEGIDELDEIIAALPGDSGLALAASADRATTVSDISEARGDRAVLAELTPDQLTDARVVSRTPPSAGTASRAGLIGVVAGFLGGVFLGVLLILARAYFDTRVRSRSDLTKMGIPTFGIVNGAATTPEGGALELAVALAAPEGDDRRHALLAYDGVDGPSVLRHVSEAGERLGLELPSIEVGATPSERLRLATEKSTVVLLVAPGETRVDEFAAEWNMLRRGGAVPAGAALVARNGREARRSS